MLVFEGKEKFIVGIRPLLLASGLLCHTFAAATAHSLGEFLFVPLAALGLPAGVPVHSQPPEAWLPTVHPLPLGVHLCW